MVSVLLDPVKQPVIVALLIASQVYFIFANGKWEEGFVQNHVKNPQDLVRSRQVIGLWLS